MLEELIGQVKRLFSTKSNGARLVCKITDRLHYYKQILLATSMILLLGYSQFRAHFECEGWGTLDKRTTTNLCWSNGTTTSIHRDHQSGDQPSTVYNSGAHIFRQLVPHVGLRFVTSNDGRYQIVSHNYMKSIWGLLIVMAACSYYAQRKWSLLFESDVMKALLNLPGSEKLKLVKKAQEAQIHTTLRDLPSKIQLSSDRNRLAAVSTGCGDTASANSAVTTSFSAENVVDHLAGAKTSPLARHIAIPVDAQCRPDELEGAKELKGFKPLIEIMESIGGEVNEHNHSVDYYPNQLIYMLLARRTVAYKLCELHLRKRLLCYSIVSFSMTSLQCIIPWLVVGPRYPTYGWDFAKSWIRYMLRQVVLLTSTDLETKQSIEDSLLHNSIDYELSAYIWPITTQCKTSRYNYRGMDEFTVQCMVPINEICSKLFFVIWWFTAINMLIEFYSLLDCLMNTSVHLSRTRLAKNCWPKSKYEARKLATFRYRHASLLRKEADINHDDIVRDSEISDSDDESGYNATAVLKRANVDPEVANEVSEKRRKQLEAHQDRRRESESHRNSRFLSKRWYLSCSRELCQFLASKSKDLSRSGRLRSRPRVPCDEDGFRESHEDSDIYQLLYLMYLRTGCSRIKIEQIIKMSSIALERYLACVRYYSKKVKHNPLAIQSNGLQRNDHQLDDDYSSVRSSPKAFDGPNEGSNNEPRR